MMDISLGRRITVIGSTGTGKTTLACQLALCLGVPCVELDALYWGPNWTPTTVEDFRARIKQAISGDEWVVDGNYSRARDIVWARTLSLIWLDYSLPVSLYRLARRTLRRVWTREELWSGNHETVKNAFFSRDAFLWAIRTHAQRRRRFETALQQPEYAHLQVIRHHSPQDTKQWAAGLVAPEYVSETRTQL